SASYGCSSMGWRRWPTARRRARRPATYSVRAKTRRPSQLLRAERLARTPLGRLRAIVRSAQRLLRASRSENRLLPLSKIGALAASVVASLSYPLAVGPRPALAGPVA